MAGAESHAAKEDAGVLGWLGFIIVNLAAWGIIATSSFILAWGVAFALCIGYTTILIGAAVYLERRGGAKPMPFVNLLWVLGCVFMFVSGSFLALNLFGSDRDIYPEEKTALDILKEYHPLSHCLPGGSSPELREWADAPDEVHEVPQPNFNNFRDYVFFPALPRKPTKCGTSLWCKAEVLWYSNGKSNKEVSPLLYTPRHLLPFKDRLIFSANLEESLHCSKLFSISRVGESATLVSDLGARDGQGPFCIVGLRVSSDKEKLYIKAYDNRFDFAAGRYGWAIKVMFYTDGTDAGMVRLDNNTHSSLEESNSTFAEHTEDEEINVPQMWGVLLFGDLPMLGVSVWVLADKKLPGISLNIFGGVWIATVLLFSIVAASTAPTELVMWFSAVYAGLCCVAVVFVHIKDKQSRPWLEELKSWVLVPASSTFFFAVHGVMEIYVWELENGWWLPYFVAILFQVAVSLLLHRTFPMVLAAIGLFEVAWKISYEITNLFVAHPQDSDAALLTMLFLLALQGGGIMVIAGMYASRREKIDGKVRELLSGNGSRLLPAEREGD